MCDFMLSRFREICPVQKMEDLDVIEAKKSVLVAFEIIGFSSEKFDEAFTKTWESYDGEMLSDFVYDVWRDC